ncbi:MAG: methyltransferase domain-containing protein [Candidatus Omnitrophica bacterium]|nr:methyltransferase domain-containing protein [Candidatus Omnitrophota bacterium]
MKRYIPELTRKEISENHAVLLERALRYKEIGLDHFASRGLIIEKTGDPRGKILEIGTGRGITALALARGGYSFLTIDNDAEMLRTAAMNLAFEGLLDKAEFYLMDASRLSFEAKSFQTVYMIDALHHMEDVGEIFPGIDRVLSPGGKFVVADLNGKGRQMIDDMHSSEGRAHPVSSMGEKDASAWLSGKGYSVTGFGTDTHWVLSAVKGG